MKYSWGIWAVLSLAIVAGCGGGTTTDDAGTDAFRGPVVEGGVDAPAPPRDTGIDAPLDAFRANDVGSDTNVSSDANIDSGSDAGSDSGHDASADGGHDAASTAPDGGCLAIEGEMGVACNPADPSAHVCATGFTCQASSGVIVTHSCQIRCDSPSFSCPCGTSCFDHSDKATSWRQCDQL